MVPDPVAAETGDVTRLHSLAAMARVLGRSRGLDAIVELAAEEALSALVAASVSVSRLDPGGHALRTLINVGELGPGEVRFPADEVYLVQDWAKLGEVVGDHRTWTAAIDDPRSDPAEVELLHALGKGSALAAPLVVDGVPWGEFYVTRRVGEPRFGEGHVAYATALTAIVAGAVSRALREETLERLAYTDPLTGLPNRRAFDEAADAADQRGGRVSVVVVDVNGLKAVNDSFGHFEGDDVLRAVAHLLRTHFSGGLVARLGGDEFGVVLVDRACDQVMAAAGAACAAAAALPHGEGIACGVASAEPGGVAASVRDLVRAADAAQYRAKRRGGNGIELGVCDGAAPESA